METAFPDLQLCYPLRILPVPRRRRQDVERRRLRAPARGRDEPGVRRLRRLDGRVPRARRRHHARDGASASWRVAAARLV